MKKVNILKSLALVGLLMPCMPANAGFWSSPVNWCRDKLCEPIVKPIREYGAHCAVGAMGGFAVAKIAAIISPRTMTIMGLSKDGGGLMPVIIGAGIGIAVKCLMSVEELKELVKKNGEGIKKNGEGIEKNGTGIEENGEKLGEIDKKLGIIADSAEEHKKELAKFGLKMNGMSKKQDDVYWGVKQLCIKQDIETKGKFDDV